MSKSSFCFPLCRILSNPYPLVEKAFCVAGAPWKTILSIYSHKIKIKIQASITKVNMRTARTCCKLWLCVIDPNFSNDLLP